MLEAENITFGYGKKVIYQGFSISIAPGERVAISAPSGFGKTSLCRVLAGYERPWEGRVLVDGAPLPDKGACPVQLIIQHPETAVDPRLRMAKTLEEAGGVSERIASGLGLREEWFSRFPHELSGGELQRFCIARALAAKPRYLIADEMSTMLDVVTQAQIWRFLLSECERANMGLLFVSHSPALTRKIATRVVDLRECAKC